jgi:hypothetical protein
MKIARIIAAGSLAACLASLAQAAITDIYVSGSTAYRSQVVSAEITVATAGITGAGFSAGTQPGEAYTASTAFSLSNLQGQSISVIHGFDASGNEIVFHNHFTGSTAGLCDLANNNTAVTFISDANSSFPAVGTTAVGLTADGTAAPVVTMSDCAYTDAATVLSSTGINAAGKTAAANITSAAPVEGGVAAGAAGFVGSVDFEWVLGSVSGPATASPIANITQDVAQALLSDGFVPGNYVTGNSTDVNAAITFVGRNEDSGSRVLYQAASWAYGTGNKFGLGAGTTQYLVTQSGVALPQNASYSSLAGTSAGITAVQKWPRFNWNGSNYTTSSAGGWALNTESAITWATLGHSGYNSGGDVAAILESPNPVTGVTGTPGGLSKIYLVTCIGSHDAASALTNSFGANATALTYNGVAYSKANIENGNYALWNFEHLYYLTNGAPNAVASGSVVQADADAVADVLYNGTFGTSSTDVGIAGNIVSTFPVMANRTATAGSYLQ